MPIDKGSAAKCGPLTYTSNYVYNNADCLGKGATASVYLARSRSNGSQAAVKVFSERESRHITSARIRETELLRSTNHKNVMRLLAVERELESGLEVLVLDYCQAGSVHTLLEQPENGFGFAEKECLLFLKDICAGLRYLRSRGIIHRDIKPGNILKKVEEDGSSVFVLTDFGAARELTDDETFTSIYGTEEYIHPHMYRKGVLQQAGESEFTSSVDLWSLAVTIYHVCTGHLPFQPFAGRNDSTTMFQIVSGRASGDISGIQRTPDGPVDRSKVLPETTNISRCLRGLLRPIIAGLLEADVRKALTFDQCFDMVQDIIEMKTMVVYHCNATVNLTVYLRKTDCFVHLQEKLASLTDVSADRQIITLAHKELFRVVPINEQIISYPKSILNSQLFLYEKDNFDVQKPSIPKIPPFPSFAVGMSLSNDSTVAKRSAATAYYIESKTKEVLERQNLEIESFLNLSNFVHSELQPINVLVPELERELLSTKKRLDSICLSQENVGSLAKLGVMLLGNKRLFDKFSQPDDNLTSVIDKACKRREDITGYLLELTKKINEHSKLGVADKHGCEGHDECLMKVGHLRQGIHSVASTFSKHKKYGELHPHEQFIHGVERNKLENLCVTVVSQFQSHCVHKLKVMHIAIQKQSILLLKHLSRLRKVETNIKCVTDCQTQIVEKLDKVDDQYSQVSAAIKASVPALLAGELKMTDPETKPFTELPKYGARELSHQSSFGGSVPSVSGSQSKSSRSSDSSHKSKKSALIDQLISGVNNLQTVSSEIESVMDSNTNSLLQLKRSLEDTPATSSTVSPSQELTTQSKLKPIAEDNSPDIQSKGRHKVPPPNVIVANENPQQVLPSYAHVIQPAAQPLRNRIHPRSYPTKIASGHYNLTQFTRQSQASSMPSRDLPISPVPLATSHVMSSAPSAKCVVSISPAVIKSGEQNSPVVVSSAPSTHRVVPKSAYVMSRSTPTSTDPTLISAMSNSSCSPSDVPASAGVTNSVINPPLLPFSQMSHHEPAVVQSTRLLPTDRIDLTDRVEKASTVNQQEKLGNERCGATDTFEPTNESVETDGFTDSPGGTTDESVDGILEEETLESGPAFGLEDGIAIDRQDPDLTLQLSKMNIVNHSDMQSTIDRTKLYTSNKAPLYSETVEHPCDKTVIGDLYTCSNESDYFVIQDTNLADPTNDNTENQKGNKVADTGMYASDETASDTANNKHTELDAYTEYCG